MEGDWYNQILSSNRRSIENLFTSNLKMLSQRESNQNEIQDNLRASGKLVTKHY